MLSPGIHVAREAARTFNYKLNHSLGSGKPEQAIAEYIAAYRLARAVRAGPSDIDDLIGIAMHGIGVQSLGNILSYELLTEEHLAALQTGIAEAKTDFPDVRFREKEKWYTFSLLQQFEKAGLDDGFFSYMDDDVAFTARAIFAAPILINWEITAMELLQHYDELEKISEIDNDGERLKRLQAIETRIADDIRELASKPVDRTFQMLAGAGARAYLAAKLLLDIAVSDFQIEMARVRAKVRQDVSHIGIAIELFRLQHDRYPEKLGELVPEFLEELPYDRYTNGPLSYVKTETDYYVCSAGPDKESQIELLIETPEDERYEIDDSRTLLQVRLKPVEKR